jgi:hypothetical protein
MYQEYKDFENKCAERGYEVNTWSPPSCYYLTTSGEAIIVQLNYIKGKYYWKA